MNSGEYHIVPSPHGGWNITYGETKSKIQHFINRQDAISQARDYSLKQGTDFIIHYRNGKSRKIHLDRNEGFRA